MYTAPGRPGLANSSTLFEKRIWQGLVEEHYYLGNWILGPLDGNPKKDDPLSITGWDLSHQHLPLTRHTVTALGPCLSQAPPITLGPRWKRRVEVGAGFHVVSTWRQDQERWRWR